MIHKGIVLVFDENGKFTNSCPIDLPIETHAQEVAWGQDFFRKVNEFTKFRKWLLRLVLGRYAYRELVGLRDALEYHGWSTKFDYGLEGQEYHKDKVRL